MVDLAYGSEVTFKNNGHGGGLLHSHVQRYPSGSEQQQVTCYHHKDSNNEWIIYKPWGTPQPGDDEEVQYVKNGDIIRLGKDDKRVTFFILLVSPCSDPS